MRKNIGEEVQPVKEWVKRKNTEYGLRPDHPLQRCAEQWDKSQTSNLIRRTLEEKPIPDIFIAQQDDPEHKGCTISWLIDGKQRITTMERFINNKFRIHIGVRNPIITYQGYTPETKIKNKKEIVVRTKNKTMIYKVDEDGNKIFGEQSFDIRGKNFDELPDELQKRILDYNIKAIILYDCTNEDIQNEIRDYNSGSKMNAAQIGVNACGAECATVIRELSNHGFIKDCCDFSQKQDNQSIVMRAVQESFMTTYFIKNWEKEPEKIGEFLKENLTQEHIDEMTEIYDLLERIIPHEDDIVGFFTFKEFFIIVQNFEHFLSATKNDMQYELSCYSDFIKAWVRELVKEPYDEVPVCDNDGVESVERLSYSSFNPRLIRQKKMVEDRTEVMNMFLDKYLDEYCGDRLINRNDEEDCFEGVADEFISIEEIDTNENALVDRFELEDFDKIKFNTKLAMLSADVPLSIFDEEGINVFRNRFIHMDSEEKGAFADSAQHYADIVNNAIENTMDEYDSFITESNTLSLARLCKMFELNGMYKIDTDLFSSWLLDFKNSISDSRFEDILDEDILGKANYMYDNFNKYVSKEED